MTIFQKKQLQRYILYVSPSTYSVVIFPFNNSFALWIYMKKNLIGLLAIGHIVTDINQGALPALLPFLIMSHHLSFAAAASLIFASNISSSVIQPLFGYFADTESVPWIMPAGMLLAGAGLALTGLFDNYWLIFASVALSGIGVAAFHPEAARMVHLAAGNKKGTGISVFTSGGNIGFAIGPVFATLVLTAFGMKGSMFFFVPVLIISLLFVLYLPSISAYRNQTEKKVVKQSLNEVVDDWSAFGRLLGGITCRSILFFGLNTFIPLYWIHVLKQSKAAGNSVLSLLLLTGVVGTLFAGRMADRYGNRTIIRFGFASLIPFLFMFIHFQNVTWTTAMAIPVGFLLFVPFSPMVVLGQKYLPNRMGLASGITIGLAVSIGGIFAPLLGLVADHYGIKTILECLVVLPVIALVISFLLPAPSQQWGRTSITD
jgi:FSR family fosmidomycin resistance protein-like MFS transporter